METYTDIRKTPHPTPGTAPGVTLSESAWTKMFTIPSGAVGWRIYNPDDTDSIMVYVQRPGDPDPTDAQATAGDIDYLILANKTQDDGLRGVGVRNGFCSVWGRFTAAPSKAVVYPRALFGPVR